MSLEPPTAVPPVVDVHAPGKFFGIFRRKFDGNGRIRVPQPWRHEDGSMGAVAYASGPGVIFRTFWSFDAAGDSPVAAQTARPLAGGRTSVSNIIYEAAGLRANSWVVLIGCGEYVAMVEDRDGWQGRAAEVSIADPITPSATVESSKQLPADLLRALEPLIGELRRFLDAHEAVLEEELRDEMEVLVEDLADQLRQPRGVRVLMWTVNVLIAFLVSLAASGVWANYSREINRLVDDLVRFVSGGQ